jgi:hypothetical protein
VPVRKGRTAALVTTLGAVALTIAACGGTPRSASTGHPGGTTNDASAPKPPGGTGPSAPTTTTTTTVPPQPGWTVLATESTGVAVDERTVTVADGTTIRVIRFRAHQVRFDLHVGSQDPPSSLATLPADAQPVIAATEAPSLLAAFNGGFKAAAAAGGVEIDGHVLTPLVPGMASLVIDASGGASIGVWGTPGVPPSGSQPWSVRQNLPPLVIGGAVSQRAGTWGAWGATLGGGADVARSALGTDSAGDLLYAASMSTVPLDLAEALVGTGADIAMELDINPAWVQADVASAPGAPLAAEVPGQNPPADQYQLGWTRDFVVALARG